MTPPAATKGLHGDGQALRSGRSPNEYVEQLRDPPRLRRGGSEGLLPPRHRQRRLARLHGRDVAALWVGLSTISLMHRCVGCAATKAMTRPRSPGSTRAVISAVSGTGRCTSIVGAGLPGQIARQIEQLRLPVRHASRLMAWLRPTMPRSPARPGARELEDVSAPRGGRRRGAVREHAIQLRGHGVQCGLMRLHPSCGLSPATVSWCRS